MDKDIREINEFIKNKSKELNKENKIILSPYDIFRISIILESTEKEIVNRLCEIDINKTSGLPVLFLKKEEITKENETLLICPFYEITKRGCFVNSHKPTTCVLTPFDKTIKPDINSEERKLDYFIPKTCECNAFYKEQYSPIEWLNMHNLKDLKEFFLMMHDFNSIVLQRYNLFDFFDNKNTIPSFRIFILDNLLSKMYYNYKINRSFIEQLKERIEEIYLFLDGFASLVKKFDLNIEGLK